MGSFKLGDNIVYNLAILNKLYQLGVTDLIAKNLFRKLQIITIVSIIEAILHDFHFRAKFYTFEGVKNLHYTVIEYMRSRSIDKFESLIASAQKHKIFDDFGEQFYLDLHELRKLRNRVHIQNEKNDFDPDERHAFSNLRLIKAEKSLERICRLMLLKYDRHIEGVAEFEFPWEPHFPTE
jgi:hypothetical protein